MQQCENNETMALWRVQAGLNKLTKPDLNSSTTASGKVRVIEILCHLCHSCTA